MLFDYLEERLSRVINRILEYLARSCASVNSVRDVCCKYSIRLGDYKAFGVFLKDEYYERVVIR